MVVEEIRKKGGKAVANYDSVEFGEKIIATAVKEFGTVHILLNNAGILRDISFRNMKDVDWDLVMKVHVEGSYKASSTHWLISGGAWRVAGRGMVGAKLKAGLMRVEEVVCQGCMAYHEEAKVWSDN